MALKHIHTAYEGIFQQISRGVRRSFPTPGRCELSLPGGFPAEAFNGKGEIKPWHVFSMVDAGRTLAFVPGADGQSFLDLAKVFKDYFIFIGSTRLKLTEDMYNLSTPKTPLVIEKELVYQGTASSTIRTTVSNRETGCLFAECWQQSVAVARETRKPSPLPEWWRDRFVPLCSGEPLQIVRLQRPDQSQIDTCSMQVQASDTDPYYHVSWTTYLKICLDAFALSTYTKNPSAGLSELLPHVRCVDNAYLRECKLGDKLSVDFWTDENSRNKTNFEIVNAEGKPSLHSSVEFFTDPGS